MKNLLKYDHYATELRAFSLTQKEIRSHTGGHWRQFIVASLNFVEGLPCPFSSKVILLGPE